MPVFGGICVDTYGQAPELGAVQSKVGHAGFDDPREETQGLHVRVGNRIHATGESVSTGEHRVHEARQAGLRQLNGAADQGFGNMDADKSGYFLSQIKQAAHGTQSAAEIQYDLLGGAVYTTAKAMGVSKEYASGSFSGFIKAFESARSDGKSTGEAFLSAIETVPEEGGKAVGFWVDQQVSKMEARLTPSQLEFYRKSMYESFAGVSIFGTYGGDSGPIRQQLLNEHGRETGADIADLLKQAASQNRGDLAGLVGQYNHAMEGVEDFSSNAAEYKKKDSHTTPNALKPVFKEVESRLNLPPGLLEKMASAESSWDTHALSNKGASGLMQLMPGTAKRFHVANANDPKQAIEGAGRYMRWLLDRYDGNLEKAVAAYNAGEGRVDEYHGVPPFAETREYVKRVLK